MYEINLYPRNNTTEAQAISQQQIQIKKQMQCRICLGSQNCMQTAEKLISPCKCMGTLKFVHISCLQDWISKIIDSKVVRVKTGKAHIYCQLCKQKIYFKTRTTVICKDAQQRKTHFISNLRSIILLFLLLLTNLGFFSALLNYLLFVGFRTLSDNNVVLVSLVISGMTIFSIVSLVSLAFLIEKLFFNKKIQVFGINENPMETHVTEKSQDC